MNIIEFDKIDKAMEYYNIDQKYKEKFYECAKIINSNVEFNNNFFEVFELLFLDKSEKYRDLQGIENLTLENLFIKGFDPFVTNLILILGFEIHDKNMKCFGFSVNEIQRHKDAIRYLFVEDMEIKKHEAIRVGLMLWGIYYIRVDLVYIGRLQYQKCNVKNNRCTVHIHIPNNGKLDFNDVLKSINDSRLELKKYYGNYEFDYFCNSWLLSNQVYEIIDKNSNIAKFRNLFDIHDGEDCIEDLLYFVYNRGLIENYEILQEDTSLQRIIKQNLINGKIFYLGKGKLK